MKNSTHTDCIRDAVRGRWLNVLGVLAPEITDAIERPGRHIPCPVHGGQDGFRLFKDADLSGGGICNTCGAKPDGFDLLRWLKNWSFPETLTYVEEVIGGSKPQLPQIHMPAMQPSLKEVSRQRDLKLKALMQKIWRESYSLNHDDADPARRYLENRGLDSWIPTWTNLRFHPAMQYRNDDGELLGHYPAILAMIENNGKPITLHRTFITDEGYKAPVENPKMMMPIPSDRNITGAAIKLGPIGRILSVAEGIETALAVYEATGLVTWSLVNTALMMNFAIPAGVEKLIIWADLDNDVPLPKGQPKMTGLISATKLAEKACGRGIDTLIRIPKGPLPSDQKSIDWLDVLNKEGPNGFCFNIANNRIAA